MSRPSEHPVRAARHNEVRAVIRLALRDAGTSITWLADQLGPGITRQALDEKLREDGDGTLGPHDLVRICELVPLVRDRLGLAGPRSEVEPSSLTEHASQATEANAALSRALFAALADGQITGSEAEKIAKVGEALSEHGRNVTAAARAAGNVFDRTNSNGRGRA